MISFPNSKINLGLSVLEKRSDGFHNIESVFYPIFYQDALEIIESREAIPFKISSSGLEVAGPQEENLIWKAWKKLSEIRELPNLRVHLHKNIPMGAGLGGGSADASFFLKGMNEYFELGLKQTELISIASKIGSDCAFFIENKALFACGKGDELSPVSVDLNSYFIAIVHPNIHSNTAIAYKELDPHRKKSGDLKKIVETIPVSEWKNCLFNHFEDSVFRRIPQAKEIKDALYKNGAIYASLSGSGSAVYGIFDKEPVLKFDSAFHYFLQKPSSKVL